MKQLPTKTLQGMTLVEILLAVSLFGFILISGFSALNTGTDRPSAVAASQRLKAVFDSARAEAQRDGTTVAIAFPTSNGTEPWVSDCYKVKGKDKGFITRVISLSDQNRAGAFVGTWSVPSALSFAVLDPRDFSEARFEDLISSWLPPELQEAAVYFYLPNGTLTTNGLASIGEEYPVVIASSLSHSGGSLQSAENAVTLMISRTGQTRLERGVIGGLVSSAPGDAGLSSGSITVGAPADNPPSVEAVEILPAPVDPNFVAAAGVEGVVQAGSVATFRVVATDTDKGPLFCQITADVGSFSHSEEIMMTYEPTEERWVSCWQWRAPATAVVDEIYDFEIAVRDEENNSAVFSDGAFEEPSLLIVPEGKLLYSNLELSNNAGKFVRSCDFDGHGLKTIFHAGGTAGPSHLHLFGRPDVSRDGRRLALGRYVQETSDVMGSISVMNSDGTEVQRLGNPATNPGDRWLSRPVFSVDGKSIYATASPSSGTLMLEHVVFTFDAAGNVIESPSPYPGQVVGWSGDGTQALVQKDMSGTSYGNLELVICDDTGAELESIGTDMMGLDWTSLGIYYARGLSSSFSPVFPYTPIDDFDLYRREPSGAETLIDSNLFWSSAIGGDGQFLFFHAAAGLVQRNLATGVERVIVRRHIPMGSMFDDLFKEIGTSF